MIIGLDNDFCKCKKEQMLLHLLLLHLEYKNSSVINFVHLVINGCNLAGIRYKSYQEGAFYYIDCKGTITTDYQKNDLKSASDVYALFKDSFKDLLWELLEAELDVSLGYDKTEKHDIEITLYYILI